MYSDVKAIIKDRFDKVFAQTSGTEEMYPQESKLRISLPILDGKSQYIFDIKNAVTDNVVEQHLDRNDVFVMNQIGVLIGLKNKTTGVTKLYSYAPKNDGVNPSIHEVGFTDDQIESLYNGILSWNVDNKVMLAAYPMEKFKKVPRQQGAFVLDSNDAAVQEGIQGEWTIDNALELFMPRYTIAGTRDHKIAINFPAAGLQFALNDPTHYEASLVLYLDGFLVKGGCEYKGGTGRNPFGQAVGQW
jgi:hypothetical protein